MKDSVVEQQARMWVESLDAKWRLQILSKRVRLNADGTRKEIPTRIRRFAEGIPWAFVKPALDYLLSKAPYRGRLANGVEFDEEYRPTLTVWQRDQRETVAGSQRPGDATYTLIQDLVENTDRDAYMLGSQSSCSEETVTDYVWDAADVEDLPQGGQGVTYAVAAVHRNDDGTFDYQVVKRVAKTQEFGWTTVRSDAFSTVEEKLYNNVYTDDSGGYADDAGNPIVLPEGGDGVLVRVENLRENDDCTLAFTLVRETAVVPNTLRDMSTENQYEETRGRTRRELDPLGEAPDAHDGVVTTHDSRLQADGSFENSAETKTEQPVEDALVRVQVGRKGRRVTREDRNQPTPASMDGVEIGGAVEVKKTPGRLFDNSVTVFDKSGPVRAGDLCKEDAFVHTDAVTWGGAEMPADADHVQGGGTGGKVVTRRTEMDDDGAITQVVEVDQEKPQVEAGKTVRKTTRAVITQTTDRNVPTRADAVSKVGESKQHEMTPGGLYNFTHTTVEANTEPDEHGDAATVFEKTETAVTLSTNPPAHKEAPAGGGQYTTVTQNVDEYGVNKETTRTVTEIPVAESAKTTERHFGYIKVETRSRNQVDKPAGTSDPTRLDIGEQAGYSETNGGRFDTVVTDVMLTKEPIGDLKTKDRYVTRTDHTGTESSYNPSDVAPGHAFAPGVIRMETITRDNNGVVTHTSQVRDARQSEIHYVWESLVTNGRTWSRYLCGRWVYRNQSAKPGLDELPDWEPTLPNGGTAGSHLEVNSLVINDFGLIDVIITAQALLATGEYASGQGPRGPEAQGDVHQRIDVPKYKYVKNGDGYDVYKEEVWTVHYRHLWSTVENMRAELLSSEQYPEIGVYPQYHKDLGYVTVILGRVRKPSEEGFVKHVGRPSATDPSNQQ